jgi:hypothetical protein
VFVSVPLNILGSYSDAHLDKLPATCYLTYQFSSSSPSLVKDRWSQISFGYSE